MIARVQIGATLIEAERAERLDMLGTYIVRWTGTSGNVGLAAREAFTLEFDSKDRILRELVERAGVPEWKRVSQNVIDDVPALPMVLWEMLETMWVFEMARNPSALDAPQETPS